MNKSIRINELSNEVIVMIEDFLQEAKEINGKFLKEVKAFEKGDILLINNKDDKLEYSLSEVGYIFTDEVDNFWVERDLFLRRLETGINNSYDSFKTISKEEFINKIGNYHYIKNKYNEMVSKLKKIQLEVEEI